MKLAQLIRSRMESKAYRIYDRKGRFVAPEQIFSEYACLRDHLLSLPDDRPFAISLPKDFRYLLVILAALEVGRTFVPLQPEFPAARVEEIRRIADVSFVLTEDLFPEIFSKKSFSPVTRSNRPPAYVLFTSGSTGAPKGVEISRAALENFMDWAGTEFRGATSEDRLLQVTEFTFDISLTDVALFLSRNVEIHFSDFQRNFYRLALEIKEKEITFLSTVPNNLSMLLSEEIFPKTDLSSLKLLLIAGAQFTEKLYERCRSLLGEGVRVYNLYGPTESTVYSHAKELTWEREKDLSDNHVSIGKPLPAVTARLKNGELFLGGRQLLNRYVGTAETSRNALVKIGDEFFYRTGDLAFTNRAGEYFITGRRDDTLKVRGFRVNLSDIDAYIRKLPYVEDAATVSLEDAEAENRLVAFLRISEDKSPAEIRADLSALLPAYQVPSTIKIVDSFPTNTSGKIDKKRLKESCH